MPLTLLEAWTLVRDAEICQFVGDRGQWRYKEAGSGLCMLMARLRDKRLITIEDYLDIIKVIDLGIANSPHKCGFGAYMAPFTEEGFAYRREFCQKQIDALSEHVQNHPLS